MDPKQKILNIIKWFSLAGIISAGYSFYEFYFVSADSFCNINLKFNCAAAIQGGYSDIFGIPVALFGIIGFGLIFICSTLSIQGKNTHKFLLPLTSIFLLSVLYFAYLSAFVVGVWCPSCIISWTIIAVLFVLSLWLRRITINQNNNQSK